MRKIKKLIDLLNESGVGEIEVTSGEESVRISRMPTHGPAPAAPVPLVYQAETPNNQASSLASPPPAPEAAAAAPHHEDGHSLKSPMVGTAYLAASPGAKPFVEVGQRVKAGDVVCVIEAMKMFNQIEADRSGVISARLIENAQPVEYDQTLFIITPDE
jgi:acetyl-CoA carboxylase biotin carboxyl carrier protein